MLVCRDCVYNIVKRRFIMNKLEKRNIRLNDNNFKMKGKIAKLEKKMLWIEDLSVIWRHKDKIKELKHRILINEQQVRFNLMTMLSSSRI